MNRNRLVNWLSTVLSAETRTGVITIVVALLAIAWANSPFAAGYDTFIHGAISLPGFTIDVHAFAADFLLAIFFLVVGIELRHEFTEGSLNSAKRALVPVAAAIGGMVVPALIFVTFNGGHESAAGWGIPMATDIAFALAVLALVAPKANPALRVFLLALAVVDDLGAIAVIAVFYSGGIDPVNLGIGVVFLVLLWSVQRTPLMHPAVLTVLGLTSWWFIYHSGIHATVAGVAIGFLLSAKHTDSPSIADRALSALLPVSSYVSVPFFVLVSSGVSLSVFGDNGLASPVFIGIIAGLVIGKPVGIILFVWVAERFLGGHRDSSLTRGDLWLVGVVSSIGFTVALLINDLAFADSSSARTGTAAVIVAAVLGAAASFVVARRVVR